MSRISVVLADDNRPIREMLTSFLRQHFDVRKTVENGRQLLDATLQSTPDVIVCDVWMPVLGGLEAMRALRQLGDRTPVVMISADREVGADCVTAGAAAFVCKMDIERDLVPAIHAAAMRVALLPGTRALSARQPRL